MAYQNLMVSCDLVGQVVCDGYLPLDGILAELWMREHHPDLFYQNSAFDEAEFIEPQLPISRLGQGELWYYACSFVEAEWVDSDVMYWHKRTVVDELKRYTKRGVIDVTKGKMKPYRMPLFTLIAKKLTWYLQADAEWLTGRLGFIDSIGKKRSSGYGQVANWQVSVISHNYSVAKNGRLMRAVPARELPLNVNNFDMVNYGIRPAYWLPTHNTYCAIPKLNQRS